VSRLSHLVNLEPRTDKRKQVFSNPDKRKWQLHRTNARMRGIEFKLTFEEWFCWWMETGHYHERGHCRGEYVMARKGDKGAYELGNIECIQAQDNSKAPHVGKLKSAETKAKMSAGMKAAHAKRLTKRAALNHGIKS
jgi:hypothetical protein